MESKRLTKDRNCLVPLSTISEAQGRVIVQMEMPGIDKDDLTIKIEGDQLNIYGKRDTPEEKGHYIIRERSIGDFLKTYTLDDTVDKEKIEASMDKGILTLTLNLKESVKPRKIQVKTN